MWGIPLDENGEFGGTFLSLLHPYALLLGITTVALFAMHGALYALMKTDGHFHTRIRRWINPCIITFIMLYAATSQATLLYCPHMTNTVKQHPAFFVVALTNMLAIANIPRAIHWKRDFEAFLSSCAAMIALMGLCGAGLWPNLLYSNPTPELSLTAYNASSSTQTLGNMLIIALTGVPSSSPTRSASTGSSAAKCSGTSGVLNPQTSMTPAPVCAAVRFTHANAG